MTPVGKWMGGVVAVAVLVGATVWFQGRQELASTQAELARARQEVADRQKELEAALSSGRRSEPNVVVVRTNLIAAAVSPAELLQRLAQVRPAGAEKAHQMRDVVYYLEALERVGEPAVPVIRTFLQRFEDVAYDADAMEPEESSEAETQPPRPNGRPERPADGANEREQTRRQQWEQVARALNGRAARRSLPRMNYDLPPTLRIGLMDSLKDIGGEPAELTLVEVVQQSGRAFEIAYASKQLKALSGDRWREPALATAYELLQNPSESGSKARVDRRSEDYLYVVLDLFGDTAFAETAGRRLVRDDGTLDRGSFNYLARTLQQNALPTFQAVFNDPRVTNLVDRASLLQQAMPYLGADPAANAMFTSVVTNEELPAQVRGMVLQSLARTEGETPDLTSVQQRYDLLQSLKPQLEAESYRRVNASLAKQLGVEVSAEDAPRARRRDGTAPGRPGRTP